MITYLKQFERDFARAKQQIIDASEGGMPKANTQAMPLAEAIESYATQPVPKLPIPNGELDAGRLAELIELLRTRTRELNTLRYTTRDSIGILRKMRDNQRDKGKMNRLFEQLNRNTRKVEGELHAAFQAASQLNAMGSFKRAKADRLISRREGSGIDRQRDQIERDLENLDWLVQSCDEGLRIFREALQRAILLAEQQRKPQAA